jgi:hypothetical protein
MKKNTLRSLVAMALMVGGAAVQLAGAEQSGTRQTPMPGLSGPQLADTQPEYGIRPAENPGSATSPSLDVAVPARESSGVRSSEIKTDGDIRYVSGGIGESERTELDALSSQFNLHMLFATQGSGEYLSAVQVTILDAHSGPVLSAESKGPWFFAQLPPGNYSVEVTPTGLRGQDETQRKAFHVDRSGQSRLDFYWKK